jgi:hypothetical protein
MHVEILRAQSPVQMVISMNNVYAKASSFTMSVEMNMFIGTNDITPVQSYTGEVCKSGELYYSSLMGKTTLCNKECTIFIDDREQTIVYSKNPDKRKRSNPTENIVPDTGDFGKHASYTFGKGTATGSRIVIIPVDQSLYKKIEMVINKTSFVLEEVVYYYSDNENFSASLTKTCIRYTSVKLNAAVPMSKFSETNFVVRKNGKLTGAGKYAGYEVFEQTNELPDQIK